MDYIDEVIEYAESIESDAVIVAGKFLPQIKNALPDLKTGNVEFLYLLTEDQIDHYRTRGAEFYFLQDADILNLNEHGIDLKSLPATLLPMK